MTDNEWRYLQAHYLSLHNIYLSDAERSAYDTVVSVPDGPRDTKAEQASREPGAPDARQGEAPGAPEALIPVKSQLAVDLTQFIKGEK